MEASRVRCILVLAGAPSRRVGPNGVLIGRQQDCDLVGDDPRLSRRHALVRLTGGGAEILPVGKQPIEVNGKSYDRPHELRDGDEIRLPGMALSVQLAAQRPALEGPATFRLQRGRGGNFGIAHSPFVIGGGTADDLIVQGWPASALVLHIAQRELFVEVATGRAKRNGAELATETLEPLVPGDQLTYRDEEFTITQGVGNAAATTAVVTSGALHLPTRVEIEILPRGGRVVFSLPEGDRTVFLHDRRLDLVVALLRPPEGYRPGDFIPDEVVSSIVWPRNPGASRTEINVLIARCRKDFVEAGLSGPRLLQRAPTGGATRIELAPGAHVIVSG